ncbi:protease-associated domain-containing protein 1-like isoform X2 [Oscarella lobularis]|uniref:protease-associated domain-containing protein 1-like isoform X2 n=1 Tax=Oscarella lobularis TaxID=121494 RepID=UPI00331395B7
MLLFFAIVAHLVSAVHLGPPIIVEYVYFEVLEPYEIGYVYRCLPAKNFGSYLMTKYDAVALVPTDPVDSCSSLRNRYSIAGSVALATRGGCSFMSKAIVAEQHGAVAIIIADNDEDNESYWIDMIGDETERDVTIPAMFLLGTDGREIKRALKNNHMSEALISIPINMTNNPRLFLRETPWTLR